ncbi:MAG: hypothetical protein C5B60_06140, partial [Chloroflexi bacterium]
MKTIIGLWSNAGLGTVRLELSKYALIYGTINNAPRFYQIPLDASGRIPEDYQIWCNDEIMPEGTYYRQTVRDMYGYIIHGPEQAFICGPAPVTLTPETTVPAPPPPFVPPSPPLPPQPPPLILVSITPGSATLAPGETQQFTQTVTGTTNTAVVWSASLGTITAAGVYTAPSVTAATIATVTATSVADPTASASISVS